MSNSPRRVRQFSNSRRQVAHSRHAGFRPRLECLEDRLAPAVFIADPTGIDEVVDTDAKLSLREAIHAANATTQRDTIQLVAGTYTLTLPTADEDGNNGGDLDVSAPLKIIGAGAGATILEQTAIDRVFSTVAGARRVSLSGMTITGGQASLGGGILNAFSVRLEIVGCEITANSAVGSFALGGGLLNSGGKVAITDSVISDNEVLGGGSATGGGIYSAGPLRLTRTQVIGNKAVGGVGAFVSGNLDGDSGGLAFGGGIAMVEGSLRVVRSEIAMNTAQGGDGSNGGTGTATESAGRGGFGGSAFGGGIYLGGTRATLSRTTVSKNVAEGGQGGMAGAQHADFAGAGAVGGGGGGVTGGGICAFQFGSLKITNCVIMENEVHGGDGDTGGSGGGQALTTGGDGGAGGFGGGVQGAGLFIFMDFTHTITKTQFIANKGHGGNGGTGGAGGVGTVSTGTGGVGGFGGFSFGGGLAASGFGSDTKVSRSEFTQNTVNFGAGGAGGAPGGGTGFSGSAGGGGISYFEDVSGKLTLAHTHVFNNSAASFGGGTLGAVSKVGSTLITGNSPNDES